MKTRKLWRLSIGLVAVLSVGLYAIATPAPAALAASHTITRGSGLSADASYSGQYGTPSGVVSWRVGYGISLGSMQTPSGKTITGPAVSAQVSECINCDDPNARIDFLAYSEEPVPVSASVVQFDKNLKSAALLEPVDVTVIVVDGNALPVGTAITVHVDPTQWTGVGPITIGSLTTHERTPTFKETTHTNGRSNAATATGGFSYTSPFTADTVSASNATTDSADLSDSRSMTITIEFT